MKINSVLTTRHVVGAFKELSCDWSFVPQPSEKQPKRKSKSFWNSLVKVFYVNVLAKKLFWGGREIKRELLLLTKFSYDQHATSKHVVANFSNHRSHHSFLLLLFFFFVFSFFFSIISNQRLKFSKHILCGKCRVRFSTAHLHPIIVTAF